MYNLTADTDCFSIKTRGDGRPKLLRVRLSEDKSLLELLVSICILEDNVRNLYWMPEKVDTELLDKKEP